MRNFPIRLASLDLIRGFVAVGQRMSITLAAEDLFLTQSAVSRQIIALEEALGVRLLNRGYRSIRFTAEGERFFRVADSALQQLQDGVNALASGRDRQPVTITASIGVTGLWIMPRLGGFQQRHPDIDMRVAANNKVVDLRTKSADVAIRYCDAESAPPGSLRLFGGADGDHARGYAYWLVQADSTPRDDVQVVLDWIQAEAQGVELRLEDELK